MAARASPMTLPPSKHHVAALLVGLLAGLSQPAPVAAAAASPDSFGKPSIMELAAEQAAAPPAHASQPASTAPAALKAGGSFTAREVFGFVNAGNLASPTVGYRSWNFSVLSTVAFFGLHVNSGNGALVTTDTGWSVWNSADLSGLVSTAHAQGVRVVVSILLHDFATGTPQMCAGLSAPNAANTVHQVAAEVAAKHVDGVNVDYESGQASLRLRRPQRLADRARSNDNVYR